MKKISFARKKFCSEREKNSWSFNQKPSLTIKTLLLVAVKKKNFLGYGHTFALIY